MTNINTFQGKVGVGTDNPQNKLAVAGNVTFGAGATTTNSAYHTGMLNVIGGGTRAILRIENNSSVGSPAIIFGEGGTFTEDTVPTIKKLQGTNDLAIMGGEVGIGMEPVEKLSVNGNMTLGVQGNIRRTANTDLIQIYGGTGGDSPNIFMTGHQRSSNPSNIGFRAGGTDVFQMYSSKIYTLNNVNFGINNTAPNLRFDNREKSRVSGWNFGIGHSSTNVANYMKTYGFAPNNASHFNKDFIVGGNERSGYFAVHGGASGSGSGNILTARSAIFIISPYGNNFHWSRRLGDGQLQLEANGQFNGFRVQHSGFGSYHSNYYEGWHQSGFAF